MDYETVIVAQEHSTGVITLNRPDKRNAISLKMMTEIEDAALALEKVSQVSAVVLTGGPNFFSSGADLNEAIQVNTPMDGMDYFGSLQRLNATLEKLKKPVIAAIEGFCITGGCELALACDIRIGGAGATFAITSCKIGTIPGAGGTQRLPRLVGAGNALSMLLSAESIDADEAFRIGLINKKVPAGSALETALVLAATFGRRAPLSLALTKAAVHQGLQMDLASGIELEKHIAMSIYNSSDKQEGISAFLEKREPRFVGR